MLVKGKTKSGFEFEVDSDHLKNWELLEKIADMRNGDGMLAFDVIRTILGDAQKKRLYDHCRDAKGMVPVDAVNAEISDIFGALGEADASKN